MLSPWASQFLTLRTWNGRASREGTQFLTSTLFCVINSYCLACWWIVQIITLRMNYFPRAMPEGNNSSFEGTPTRQAITVLLCRTCYRPNKRQNRKTGPELILMFSASIHLINRLINRCTGEPCSVLKTIIVIAISVEELLQPPVSAS